MPAPALAAVVPLLPTIAVIAVVAYVLWIVFINIELPSTPFGDVPEYPAWMDFDSEGNPTPTAGSFFRWLGAGAPGIASGFGNVLNNAGFKPPLWLLAILAYFVYVQLKEKK